MYNGSLYGNFRNITFTECWESYDEFLEDLKECEIPLFTEGNPDASPAVPDTWYIKEENIKTLFYLCYARYANSVIAASDINRFKYNFFSIVFCWGPTWEKKLEIQNKLRNMSDSELLISSKDIYNHAFNPSSAPSTSSLTEIEYINEQNTTNRVRSKLDAYDYLLSLLKNDVSGEFLDRFKKLFITIVMPEMPLWYSTINEEDENA